MQIIYEAAHYEPTVVDQDLSNGYVISTMTTPAASSVSLASSASVGDSAAKTLVALTFLSAPAIVGDTEIEVVDASGFSVGDAILIGDESNLIVLGSPSLQDSLGNSILLGSPLTQNYPVGTAVKLLQQNGPTGADVETGLSNTTTVSISETLGPSPTSTTSAQGSVEATSVGDSTEATSVGDSTATPFVALTFLSAPAMAGDTEIQIMDASGFSVGDAIVIGDESNVIFGNGLGSIVLGGPLAQNYPIGTSVKLLARNEPTEAGVETSLSTTTVSISESLGTTLASVQSTVETTLLSSTSLSMSESLVTTSSVPTSTQALARATSTLALRNELSTSFGISETLGTTFASITPVQSTVETTPISSTTFNISESLVTTSQVLTSTQTSVEATLTLASIFPDTSSQRTADEAIKSTTTVEAYMDSTAGESSEPGMSQETTTPNLSEAFGMSPHWDEPIIWDEPTGSSTSIEPNATSFKTTTEFFGGTTVDIGETAASAIDSTSLKASIKPSEYEMGVWSTTGVVSTTAFVDIEPVGAEEVVESTTAIAGIEYSQAEEILASTTAFTDLEEGVVSTSAFVNIEPYGAEDEVVSTSAFADIDFPGAEEALASTTAVVDMEPSGAETSTLLTSTTLAPLFSTSSDKATAETTALPMPTPMDIDGFPSEFLTPAATKGVADKSFASAKWPFDWLNKRTHTAADDVTTTGEVDELAGTSPEPEPEPASILFSNPVGWQWEAILRNAGLIDSSSIHSST
jgi:hypothetical protein